MIPGVITVQRETFKAFAAEALRLMALHAEEMNPYPDIPPNVDEQTYIAADEAGLARVYTARLDGVLIGYAVFIVQYALNWRLSLTATQTGFFVDPGLRLSTCGTRLLQHAEAALRAEGVQVLAHQQFVKHPALGRMLERNGYERMTNVWVKRLDQRRA